MIITTEVNKAFDGLNTAPLTLQQVCATNSKGYMVTEAKDPIPAIAVKTVNLIPKEVRNLHEGIDLQTEENEVAYLTTVDTNSGARHVIKLGTGLIERIDLYYAVESRCTVVIVNEYGYVVKELHLNLRRGGVFKDVSDINQHITNVNTVSSKGLRLNYNKVLLSVKKLRRDGYYRVTTVSNGIITVQDEISILEIGNIGRLVHHFKAFDDHVIFTLNTDKARRFKLKRRSRRNPMSLAYFEIHVNVTDQALKMNKLLDALPCNINGDQAFNIIQVLDFDLLASRIRLSLPSFYQKPYFRKLALRLGIIEYNDDKKELVTINTKFTQGDN